jgi:hypothetical protein
MPRDNMVHWMGSVETVAEARRGTPLNIDDLRRGK